MIHRRPFLATLPILALVACGTTQMQRKTHRIDHDAIGRLDGRTVELFTLTNAHGQVCKLSSYGATLTELWLPDRDGELDDVVLGFDTLERYRDDSPYFGCTVGRVANRIANGRFELGGVEYTLATNNGRHHLHGGERGFDKRVWDAEPFMHADGPAVRFRYDSPDGEEGYPGRVQAEVTYVWTDVPELRVEMRATCDQVTPVNLAHHTYWNLGGHGSGTVLDHVLVLDASHYTPTDDTLIPTGEIRPVDGTAYDFRLPKAIGRDLPDGSPPGYDLNWVVDGAGGEPGALHRVARVWDPESGRVMELSSDQPGVQLYTGNFLDGLSGKGGARYAQHGALCLETQLFPDAVHHHERPGWPSPWLAPGATYEQVMVHRFGVE